MNQSPDASSTRKQTPRIPANFLYARLVPIALGILVIVLAVIILAVFASVFMPVAAY